MKKNKDILCFYYIKPFKHNIVFYYSDDFKKIKGELNKKKNKLISKWLHENLGSFDFNDGQDAGGLTYPNKKDMPCLIWIERKKKKDWNFYENIIHEVTHLVDFTERYFNIDKEPELRAYLTTCIFSDFRKTINKYESKKM